MKTKRQKAIQNNNDLYKAIFEPHKIKSLMNDSIWYCLEKTPSLYSNLVTFSKDWKPDEIFEEIDDKYKAENWDEWSIKDSFGVLNLSKYGFKKLFDANWLYLQGSKFTPNQNSKKLDYKIIETEKDLANWRIAWDSDEKLGQEIFRNKLLDDSKVYFIGGLEQEKIVSGCFINGTKDILGISNFFAPDENIDYWSNLIEFVLDSIKCADIVGYERENLVTELKSLGFDSIGNLTVWLKS